MHEIEKRLADSGITLPEGSKAVANYVPWVEAGGIVYISGQLPFQEGIMLHPGVVGVDVSAEQAREAARVCGIHLLTHLRDAIDGQWERLVRCVKLTGFVQAGAGFSQQPEVVNGASDLMVEILGDRGRHARAAVGAASLPRNASVEIEGIFAIRDA